MSESAISIASQGLVHLGERSIPSFTGGQLRQEVAAQFYEPTRRALLSEINWRFATHTQQLAQRAAAPNNERYQYAYALPTDPELLKVQSINPQGHWAIEGDSLITSNDTVLLTYTADADESVMPAYFSWLLGLRLAVEFAIPITKKKARKESAREDYDAYLPTARYADSSQQPNEPVRDSPFVDCRN